MDSGVYPKASAFWLCGDPLQLEALLLGQLLALDDDSLVLRQAGSLLGWGLCLIHCETGGGWGQLGASRTDDILAWSIC